MFKLYTSESGRFSFLDYGDLLKYATGAKTALEFGPGISTLALIEAGVKEIYTFEHDATWLEKAVEALEPYSQCSVLAYDNVAPEAFTGLEDRLQFDLAFVDSPSGVQGVAWKGERVRFPGQEDCSRLNTCLAALRHSKLVLLHDWFRANERATLGRLEAMGHKVTIDRMSCLARIDRK